MSGLMTVTCAVLLLLNGWPQKDRFSKYKTVEAYEIRPGILVMPRYSDDGLVCEIGIENRHYSPEIIRLDCGLSRDVIDQVFNELVPADERGPRLKDFGGRDMIVESGHSLTTNMEYENVLIQIFGQTLSTGNRREIVEGNLVATIQWKTRRCR